MDPVTIGVVIAVSGLVGLLSGKFLGDRKNQSVLRKAKIVADQMSLELANLETELRDGKLKNAAQLKALRERILELRRELGLSDTGS